MSTKEEELLTVVGSIFTQCLAIRDDGSKTRLSIVFDTFGQPVAEAIIDYAIGAGLDAISLYLPYCAQRRITKEPLSNGRLGDIVAGSDVLITALSSADECTEFRKSVLHAAQSESMKIVHMPGVTSDILLSGNSGLDYEQLHRSCMQVRALLSSASTATIITTSRSGTVYRLNMSLESRNGHLSGGLAEPGEILNLPTGESYIAPVESSVAGQIVLNGSAPDAVFHDGDEVILAISAGRLMLRDCTFSQTSASTTVKSLLTKAVTLEPDDYRVGELGIGLNPSIRALTGEVILDEKMAGTVHVAFGDNALFDGHIHSRFHHDLVVRPTELVLGERTIPGSALARLGR